MPRPFQKKQKPARPTHQPARKHRPSKSIRNARPSVTGYVPPSLRDASRGIRIQKALAAAGVASRRDCEKLITDGRVTVNGERLTGLPAWVDPQRDRIEIDAQPVQRTTPRGPSRPVYVILHKPKRTITTTQDPMDRRSVADFVDATKLPGNPRLFPVGRLDADSTGLILLTNDGELAQRLTHPSYGVSKTYLVSVRGRITTDHIELLRKGLFLARRSDEGRNPSQRGDHDNIRKVKMDQVRIVSKSHDRELGDRCVLEVTLHEGHNRIIRRMLARLGINVRRLQRIGIGPLSIKGLPRGAWRELSTHELKSLRKAAGYNDSLENHP